MNNVALQEKLQKLKMLFDLSDKAFKNYLDDKFYLHALCINKANKLIYAHIVENAAFWPTNLQLHLIVLLNHFDIWFVQFADFERQKDFKLNEAFVFYHLDNKSAYPKDAVEYIKSYNE